MTVYTGLEDYDDPILYDIESARFGAPDEFYLKLAQRFGGSVLELGCGTGRYTIPLAHQGIAITGLDIVPQMLNHAKSKSAGLKIEWVEADARNFHLGRKFRLIFESGAMFSHLNTRAKHEAALACVREHLESDGYFVVSSMFPNTDMMMTNEVEEDWFSYENSQGQEVRVSGYQHYDALHQVKTETAIRRWIDATGQQQERIAPLKLRHFFPQELEMLLHYNGFHIVEAYGDTDFSPLTATSPHIMYVCQLKQKP